ncbi:hypothetical protein COF72_22595 [Bacillus pseudomycoides]|nr:hypothetical protein COF72_22595 [Bacillus pseudomycoides]
MIKKSTLSQIFTLITRADNKSRNWMHDKVFYPRYKKKVAVPVLFPRKIEWVVLHYRHYRTLYCCILFVEREELFL